MCFDHRTLWAYDYARAEQILYQTGTRQDAQQYFQYWDRQTDKVHRWTPEDGSFEKWLASLPNTEDAVQCWQTHAQSSANMVVYNGGNWGPQYATFNPRGQYLTWPGGHGVEWNADKSDTTEVWEVPRGMHGVRQLGAGGLDGSGRFACWYTPE